MIRLAIVDDDERYQSQVKEYISRFEKESGGETFDVKIFSDAMDFITDYKPVYDIVFLDIEMPLLDGMTAARRLRQLDKEICIVFVTNMQKYAIEGYEVNAVDFVVKPIKYFNFTDKLKKAMGFARIRRGKEIMVKSEDGFVCVPASGIDFVEKDKNYLVYHTDRGELRERGTIEEVFEKLEDSGFAKCNSGCIVNLRKVGRVTQSCVIVGGEMLPLSRRRAAEFKANMLNFMRGGV